MNCKWLRQLSCMLALLLAAMAAQSEDLHLKKNISVGGNVVSSSETSIKGQRTRDVDADPGGRDSVVAAVRFEAHSHPQRPDADLHGRQRSPGCCSGPCGSHGDRAHRLRKKRRKAGRVEVNSTITDTGERKQMFGLNARHLKIKVTEKSSDDACTKVDQTFEVDGWYADLGRDVASCAASVAPPVRQSQGCARTRSSSTTVAPVNPDYPLVQNVTMHNPGLAATMVVSINVTEVSKQPLDAGLFDVPASATSR